MDKICETCIYFRQHYIKFGLEYSPISYGHCVYPRLKNAKLNQLPANTIFHLKRIIRRIGNRRFLLLNFFV